MKKHPLSFKLLGSLEEKLKTVRNEPLTLFEGIKLKTLIVKTFRLCYLPLVY